MISILITLVLAYLVVEEESGGHVRDSARIFAAFAELDLDLEGVMRMRDSPLPPRARPDAAPWRTIAEVVDGDSLKLDGGDMVRLLGIDSPEASVNRKLGDDLRKMDIAVLETDMVALGRESAVFSRRLAQGKRCWLEFEREPTDQYGRLLAYVHLEDGTILNEVMLRGGYAKAYINQSFAYKKRYIAMQQEAKLRGCGLWRKGGE
ncbi:MAG: thermonuclease family protein [Planctomycetota bacterium]|nr:thermonuclease family protein [Planctomycetota bacterium]